MANASKTTPASDERKTSISSDDELESEEATPPAKSTIVRHFERDSDEDSYLSEGSEDPIIPRDGGAKGNRSQNSSDDDDSDVEDTVRDVDSTECLDLPSQKRNSPHLRDEGIVAGKADPYQGNPIWQDKVLGDGEWDDGLNNGGLRDERANLMKAALAAQIPGDDSFSDESDNFPNMARQTSIVKSNIVRQDREESDYEASSLSEESSITISSDGSESEELDEDQSKATRILRKRNTKSSTYLAQDDQDDALGMPEESSGSDEKHMRSRALRHEANSASFPSHSATFKWSEVKNKIYYSFRALKGSTGDGSKTISVKNLPREMTESTLYDFFKDSGSILDIRLARDAHGRSGLGSAYLEFDSGAAAKKAVQKNGKLLQGRLISCDLTYESSRRTGSNPSSGHGGKQNPAFGSWTPPSVPGVGNSSQAPNNVDTKLQVGDEKFLSRFNQPSNPHAPAGYPGVTENRSIGRTENRNRGSTEEVAIVRASLFRTLRNSFSRSMGRKTQEQIDDQSDYFDAQNAEPRKTPLKGRWKMKLSGRRKGKWTRLFWSWRRPRWHWWHFAAVQTKLDKRRRSGSGLQVDSGPTISAATTNPPRRLT